MLTAWMAAGAVLEREDKMTTGDAILSFVKDYKREKGYAPSIREIGRGVGIGSTSHVRYWLMKLQQEGMIRRKARISRSLVVNLE